MQATVDRGTAEQAEPTEPKEMTVFTDNYLWLT